MNWVDISESGKKKVQRVDDFVARTFHVCDRRAELTRRYRCHAIHSDDIPASCDAYEWTKPMDAVELALEKERSNDERCKVAETIMLKGDD